MAKTERARIVMNPCETDAWPYSADPVMFEARRAVGQLTRTVTSLIKPPGPAVLSYIAAAHMISTALSEEVLPELVAEARARGVGWTEIGKTLGVGDTAAQKRFGGKKPDADRTDLAREEAQVVRLTNELLTEDLHGVDDALKAEIMEELDGTTPEERMRYAFGVIRGAYVSFKQAEDHLELPPHERDHDQFVGLLTSAHNRIMLVANTLLVDPALWRAIPEWEEPPGSPDAAHYHAPTTYLFYALRQLMLACNYTMRAVGTPGLDFDERMRMFATANGALEVAMLVLSRYDVQSTLPGELNRPGPR